MFQNLQRAREHFLVVVPITIGLIFVLIWMTFSSFRAAVLLLFSIPFAFIGGVLALWVRDMHLNVSTGVGFAALFGVSIMNGVLMVRSINTLRQQGTAVDEAIRQGAENCLRPILMASLVAILGLLPASLATGLGSDVQRPLATVIVWGLFSSMVLTLFVVPVGYRLLPPAAGNCDPGGLGPGRGVHRTAPGRVGGRRARPDGLPGGQPRSGRGVPDRGPHQPGTGAGAGRGERGRTA